MSEELLGHLRDLMYGPLTRSRWDQICSLLKGAPEGEARQVAFAYFSEHIGDWSLQSQGAKGASLQGLWKLTAAEFSTGNLNTSDFDYQDIDEAREREEADNSDRWENEEELHFYLEIHGDGSYREVDLTQGPLTSRNLMEELWRYAECEEQEFEEHAQEQSRFPVGMVHLLSGYEHRFEADAKGYAKSRDALPAEVELNEVYRLHEADPDEWTEDRVVLRGPSHLWRQGYVLWDGVYFQALELWYQRVTRFEE